MIGLLLFVAASQADSFGKYPLGTQPRAIVSVDLDGDGRIDAVTANYLVSTLSVLMNDGAGGFLAATTVPTSPQPSSIAAGDFDGDGNADVVTLTNGAYLRLTLHIGDGAGGFGPKIDINYALTGQEIEALDFNNDGKLDVATLDTTVADATHPAESWVRVQLGDGAGSFAAPTPYLVGQYWGSPWTTRAAFGDVNNDGTIDSLSTGIYYTFVDFGPPYYFYKYDPLLALGSGSGGFLPFVAGWLSMALTAVPPPVERCDLGDYDQDGFLDVFLPVGAVCRGNGTASFLSSLHGASTETQGPIRTYQLSGEPKIGALVFAKGGRTADVIDADPISSTLYLACRSIGAVAFGDLDGDGGDDLIVADDVGNGVYRFLNNGNGRFAGVPAFRLKAGSIYGGWPNNLSAAAVADFDQEGTLDVAATTGLGIFLAKNLGPSSINGLDLPLISGPGGGHAVEAADFDEDGYPDVAYPYGGGSVVLLRGKGDGTFQPTATFPIGSGAAVLAAGDFDGDGKLDLATGSYSGAISVLLNDGIGGFLPAQSLASKPELEGIAAGDMNGDGKLDLVAAAASANEVVLHTGNGSGGFSPATTIDSTPRPTGLALGDVNNDDRVDVVVISQVASAPGLLRSLLGNGTGGFSLQATSSFPSNYSGEYAHVTLADLCGIGRVDAVIGVGGVPYIATNDGTGRFQPFPSAIKSGSVPGSLPTNLALVADLDHDGRLDLMTGSTGSARVRLGQGNKPPGVKTLGNGSYGCDGIHGIDASARAKLGTSIVVSVTNAPPQSLGLGIVANVLNPSGADPFGVGILLYPDFLGSTLLATFDTVSDRNGSAAAIVFIPPIPSLAGNRLYTQVLFAWFGTGCVPSTYTLSSSRCLVTTVFP